MRASPIKRTVCVVLSLGPFSICSLLLVTYCFAYFASQTSGLCNAFPSVPFDICTLMFVIRLCALRLTNIGLVQCLRVGCLWNFARVCFLCFACFASQTPGLPCSARTSVPFGILHACVYVLRASPRKHRVCAVLFPRPLLCLYACVCHVLPQKHRVCAVPFPRRPVKFVRLSLSCYVMRPSPQEHQFRAVLFSRLP